MIKNLQKSLKKLAKTKIFTRSNNPLVGALGFFGDQKALAPCRIKNSGARAKRAFAILALFLIPSLALPLNLTAAPENIDEINRQINRTENSLDNTQDARLTLEKTVKSLDSEIYSLGVKMDKIQGDINSTQADIILAEKQLKKARAQLSEIIRVMYEDGQISSIEVIAKANSFTEYINRSEYLEQMQLKVKQNADTVVTLGKKLNAEKKSLTKAKADLASQKKQISIKRYDKNLLLQDTRGDEKAYQKKLKSLEVAKKNAWADYWNSQSNSNGGGSNYTGGAGSGYFIWPSSNGVLTQSYGWTDFAAPYQYYDSVAERYIWTCNYGYYPNCKIHNGIDIASPRSAANATIYAAAAGTVLKTGYNGGWGNYILIQHPNGLVTLYAHLSQRKVGAGRSVRQGQVIGIEGDTGFSTAKHLHFSVYTSISIGTSFSYESTTNPYSFL